ncbi:MAG: hypothetical protein ACLRPW_06380 [Intestinibacter sp.]
MFLFNETLCTATVVLIPATVTLQVAVLEPQVTVITVEPFFIGVTTPLFTTTIPVGFVAYVTLSVVLLGVLLQLMFVYRYL